MPLTKIRLAAAAALLSFVALSAPATAETVGEVGVDWTGNDILVDAVSDPKIEGITCHVTYFDRGVIDRLRKGNWFEDPSNNSIACHQTGPILIDDIDRRGVSLPEPPCVETLRRHISLQRREHTM